jgi:nitroreductase
VTDFFAVAHSQRACRILDAATFAPSAENRQPWEFVVVRDPELRERIGELMKRAWDAHAREHSQSRLTPEVFADVERGATGAISAAPVLVVIAADTSRGLPATVPSSIYPAIQNLLLAATAVGLGSALTTIATVYATELADAVGLPEAVVPVAVVPLGVPAQPLGPPRRDPFAAHTHRERYGTPWPPT